MKKIISTRYIIKIGILMIFALFLTACAPEEPEKRIPKIGIIIPAPAFQPAVDGFISGMAELGYIDGDNIIYVMGQNASPAPPDLLTAAQSLVEQGVDVLVPVSNTATEAAIAATDTIPIVSAFAMYTVELGYAESLAKPGGNYTGIDIGPVLPRRLMLLLELYPQMKRIYIPYQAGYVTAEASLPILRPLAEQLGLELVVEGFNTMEEAQAGLTTIPDDVEAIFTLPDIMIGSQMLGDWASAAIERGIPHVHQVLPQVGLLFAYGPNSFVNGSQASRLVDQILKGANAGDLPIEIGEFYLTFNLNTASALGIEIPDSILLRADEIILAEEESE